MLKEDLSNVDKIVVPHAGTWIEIQEIIKGWSVVPVVPHAGTWIEIVSSNLAVKDGIVVPHAGTWIEILLPIRIIEKILSFPTRERGLK
mgnify:CR=1 FL=1